MVSRPSPSRSPDVVVDDEMASKALPPVVRLTSIRKRYAVNGPYAVDDLSLDVRESEILCLLGPSGCGKTTLLRLIAGFERPDEGTVTVAGTLVASASRWVPPERRKVGFVFQDFALFPHLSVLDNVAFGLNGLPRTQRRKKAAEVLDLVGLTVFEERFPHQLSGGQQQRVALARALATEPHLLLLDEPFSNLDAALRGATRDDVRAILKRTGTTAIMVTHDQQEALSFADRVAVMRDGKLDQVGTPGDVYLHPRTAFVASFLGRTNLLRGTAVGDVAATPLGPVPLARPADGPVVLSLRPEHLSFAGTPASNAQVDAASDDGAAAATTDAVLTPVRVLRREFKGHEVTYECLILVEEQREEQREGQVEGQVEGQADGPHTEAEVTLAADTAATPYIAAEDVAPDAPPEPLPSDRRILVNASPECEVRKGDTCAVRVTGVAVVLQPSVTPVPRIV